MGTWVAICQYCGREDVLSPEQVKQVIEDGSAWEFGVHGGRDGEQCKGSLNWATPQERTLEPRPMTTTDERTEHVHVAGQAEKSIREAVIAVEEAGAHVLLTEAVVLLQQAREKVADFVDGSDCPICELRHSEMLTIDIAIMHENAATPATTAPASEEHHYISTACHHGLHARCRQECKFCGAKCACPCGHAPASEPECVDAQCDGNHSTEDAPGYDEGFHPPMHEQPPILRPPASASEERESRELASRIVDALIATGRIVVIDEEDGQAGRVLVGAAQVALAASPAPAAEPINKQPPAIASVFAPAQCANEHQAVRLALAEVGFGEHVEVLADVMLDALKHRGFVWPGPPQQRRGSGEDVIVNPGVECPTCGACPGEECARQDGELVPPHSARRRAAGF